MTFLAMCCVLQAIANGHQSPLTLSFPRVPKIEIQDKSEVSFSL